VPRSAGGAMAPSTMRATAFLPQLLLVGWLAVSAGERAGPRSVVCGGTGTLRQSWHPAAGTSALPMPPTPHPRLRPALPVAGAQAPGAQPKRGAALSQAMTPLAAKVASFAAVVRLARAHRRSQGLLGGFGIMPIVSTCPSGFTLFTPFPYCGELPAWCALVCGAGTVTRLGWGLQPATVQHPARSSSPCAAWPCSPASSPAGAQARRAGAQGICTPAALHHSRLMARLQ